MFPLSIFITAIPIIYCVLYFPCLILLTIYSAATFLPNLYILVSIFLKKLGSSFLIQSLRIILLKLISSSICCCKFVYLLFISFNAFLYILFYSLMFFYHNFLSLKNNQSIQLNIALKHIFFQNVSMYHY